MNPPTLSSVGRPTSCFISLGIVLLCFTGCSAGIEPSSCADPVVKDDYFGWAVPDAYANAPAVSSDGRHLIFSGSKSRTVWFISLQSGEQSKLDLSTLLPDSVRLLAVSSVHWCPYSVDRFVANVTVSHISNDRRKRKEMPMLIDRRSHSITELVGDTLGTFGAVTGFRAYWLPASAPDRDLFRIEADLSEPQVLELQSLAMSPDPRGRWVELSRDGSTVIAFEAPSQDYQGIAVNGRFVYAIAQEWRFNDMALSPSGRYAAVTVSDGLNGIVNIIDVSEGSVINSINVRTSYCMYSFRGLQVCFLDEESMAVSMHKDGDSWQWLYRVSIDGELHGLIGSIP
ncbi:MAG: hypothetical protein H7X80_04405 [bacterium]|nr:hypothetical protein [Candidatus Kapabacteria bacterium]